MGCLPRRRGPPAELSHLNAIPLFVELAANTAKKGIAMRHLVQACLLSLCAVSAWAQGHSDKEVAEDIARHRAMAAAHEGAAKCLEAKKGEKVCMAELQAACKGLGIGKYCGMRHVH